MQRFPALTHKQLLAYITTASSHLNTHTCTYTHCKTMKKTIHYVRVDECYYNETPHFLIISEVKFQKN